MRIISNKIVFILFLAIGLGSLLSCEDAGVDGSTPERTLLIEIADQPDISHFADALLSTEIGAQLSKRNLVYTVFAPSNDAVNGWLNLQDLNSLSDLSPEALEEFIRDHIVQQPYSLETLSSGQTTTVSGKVLRFASEDLSEDEDVVDLVYTLNDQATITTADIRAVNGLIHIIDAVLDFPGANAYKLNEILVQQENLSTLANQFARPALKPLLDRLKSNEENATFTFFAPTNNAFEDYLAANNLSSPNEISDEDLYNLLANHMLEGTYGPAELPSGEYTSVGGASLSVLNEDDIRVNNELVLANFEATNGWMYTLPAVLSFQ